MSDHNQKPFSLLVSCATMLGALSFTSLVQASDNYPEALRNAGDMVCLPQCGICHTTDPGTAATATQPFAVTLRGYGLKGGMSEDEVAEIYGMLLPKLDDSDEDGMDDIDELEGDHKDIGARDPSDPNPGATACDVEVLYGCGAHVSPQPPTDGKKWPLVLAGIALFLTGRRVFRRVEKLHSS